MRIRNYCRAITIQGRIKLIDSQPAAAFRQHAIVKLLSVAGFAMVLGTGCQSLSRPASFNPFARGDEDLAQLSGATEPTIRTVSAQGPAAQGPATQGLGPAREPVADTELIAPTVADDSLAAKSKETALSVVNAISGREQVNHDRARDLYQQGDSLFRKASAVSTDSRKRDFAKSAKYFRKAVEAAPKSAIEQDALFMQAESEFFADQLVAAAETYEKLQQDHPRNRHNDQAAARLFSITRYWIETEKAKKNSWMPFNFTDPSRPRMDTDGHAIRVLDQIRYDDPTGRLADDATMAAAAEYIRQGKYEEADEFLTDLRETFSDSEHFFLAHLLGIRTKLETYGGKEYSALMLEEADNLIKQTRTRFPDKMRDPKYADLIARAAAEVAFHRSERKAFRAQYREKRKEFRAAAFNYQSLLENDGETPLADTARERLTEIAERPAVPEQRLSWLTTIFPESKAKSPLQMTGPDSETESDSGTLLR